MRGLLNIQRDLLSGNTQGESFGAINIVVWNLDFPTSLFSTPI